MFYFPFICRAERQDWMIIIPSSPVKSKTPTLVFGEGWHKPFFRFCEVFYPHPRQHKMGFDHLYRSVDATDFQGVLASPSLLDSEQNFQPAELTATFTGVCPFCKLEITSPFGLFGHLIDCPASSALWSLVLKKELSDPKLFVYFFPYFLDFLKVFQSLYLLRWHF